MQKTLEFQQITGFGKLLQAYLQQSHPGLPASPVIGAQEIKKNIDARKNFAHRETLHRVISEQYTELNTTSAVKNNLDLLLDKNSFCITTGHQLTLMGGPLFVTYKILTTVQLSQAYKKLFPDHHFIPVFWLATEDHDKEEINHFHFHGEKFTWETTQTGAVGRFSCEGILPLIEQFKAQYPGLQPTLIDLFEKAYAQPTLAKAARFLANELFGQYGVVVVDGDAPAFKELFLPIAEKEIREKFVHRAVTAQNEILQKAGFEPAIHPREINLFWLTANDRKRLEVTGNVVRTADGSHQWEIQEFIDLVKKNPQDISPNVLLRPVYQETILPNLAYVGGPAETEYWLQLDKIFETLNITIPARVLRICATVIPAADAEKIDRTGLSPEWFMGDEDRLTKHFLDQVAAETLDFTGETSQLEQLFLALAQKARNIDPTLEPAVMAEKTRQEKSLENIFGRIRKAEKSKHEVEINRLKKLRNTFLPAGKLQERLYTLIDIAGKDQKVLMEKLLSAELNVMNLVVV